MTAKRTISQSAIGHVLAAATVVLGLPVIAAAGYPWAGRYAKDGDVFELAVVVTVAICLAFVSAAGSFVVSLILYRLRQKRWFPLWLPVVLIALLVFGILFFAVERRDEMALLKVAPVTGAIAVYFAIYWGFVGLSDAASRAVWKMALVAGIGVTALLLVGAGRVAYVSGHLGGAPARKLALQTRLFSHIWSGDANDVAMCLAEGADPNGHSTQLNHPTPLIDAARLGFMEIVQLLLAHHADPNKPDRAGHATLYYVLTSPFLGNADDKVSPEAIRVLLEHGADIAGKDVLEMMTNLPPEDARYSACQKGMQEWKAKQITASH